MKAYLRQGTQWSAVWPPAARAPPAARSRPRRRAWLRIFVVRCDLPCDPPVGGHSCNRGMIPRSIARSVTKGDRQVLWMIPKTAPGHPRRKRPEPHTHARPLRPESDGWLKIEPRQVGPPVGRASSTFRWAPWSSCRPATYWTWSSDESKSNAGTAFVCDDHHKRAHFTAVFALVGQPIYRRRCPI